MSLEESRRGSGAAEMNEPESPVARPVKALRCGAAGCRELEQPLADEGVIELYINGRYVAGLVCTMERVRELIVGFLFSEGVIVSLDQMKHLSLTDGRRCAVTVESAGSARSRLEKPILAPGCGGTIVLEGGLPEEICHKEIDHERTYSYGRMLAMGRALAERGVIHRGTRGTHGTAIFDGDRLITFAEDISRHNAVDKVVGHCRLARIPLGRAALATTGRVSSEIVRKALRNRIALIVSRTVPTATAVELADHYLITLAGAMTSSAFTVYSHPFRIERGGENR